jgi:DNA-binding beta-propeller fold protein YncE
MGSGFASVLLLLLVLILGAMAQANLSAHKAYAAAPLEAHGTFQIGDVFIPGYDGRVFWFLPNGTLNHVITGLDGRYSTGMAFDSTGRLYVTDPEFPPGIETVRVFNVDGSAAGTFGSGYNAPIAVVFDAAGNAYVASNVDNDILQFDSAGNLIDSFDVTVSNGINDIDLASDQCTLFYSDDSWVRRYDVCNDTQLSTFSGLDGYSYSVRILPDGRVLAVDGNLHLLNASGSRIKTYDIGGCMFGVSLDPDGKSFWAFSFGSDAHSKIDIETGEMIETLKAGGIPDYFVDWFVPCDTITGAIAVFGELRAAAPLYSLNLFEGSSPSDLVVDLNQEINAVAETSNLGVESATFRWINPIGDTIRTEIVSLSLDGQKAIAEDHFSPNEPGRWIVEADFGNGQVIQKELDIAFNVIPESPIGSIAAIVSAVTALLGFNGIRAYRRKKTEYPNN